MKKDDIKIFGQDSRSLYSTLSICLIVFLLAIGILIFAFNRLILTHDQYLSGEMCNLLSEKVSNSIESMTESIRSISKVLSAQNFDSPNEIYEKLSNYESTEYVSIGFVDEEGNLYASAADVMAFEKWDLLSTAKSASPVSISAPYRSNEYGQYVITIFSEFEYGNGKEGYVFSTYRFKTIQDIVATKSLVNDIEVSLIDADSANIIQCLGDDEQIAGSWKNAYIGLPEINEEYRSLYTDWLKRMSDGEDNIGLTYMIGDVSYTQNSVAISSMSGWYVSVKIPGDALSETMHTFRNYVLVFAIVLLVVVVILIINMYVLSKRQTNVFKQLSVYDPLTGVYNRRAFDLVAESILDKSKKCALIFLDVDYFKQVNDLFGHDAGDMLLKAFANILNDNFSDDGIVSRMGGDEFVVLTEMQQVDDIDAKLKKTAVELGEVRISDCGEENARNTHFSAGIAKYPADADDLAELKKCADSALYTVKERGRNGFDWYKS